MPILPIARSLKRLAAISALVAVAATATWEALSPRPDWHDAPIHLFPLRFKVQLGQLGADTAWHVLAAAVVPLVALLLLQLPRTRSSSLWVVGGVLTWSVLLELVQGFLPYRNFQLTDILANMAGCALALAFLELLRRRQKPGTR